MPKFLIEASYTTEGLKGLQKEKAASRRAVVTKMVKDLGGKVEVFYWSFGDRDAIVVVDTPGRYDRISSSPDGVIDRHGCRPRTTTLFTAEEVDKAFRKTVKYRAPGTKT